MSQAIATGSIGFLSAHGPKDTLVQGFDSGEVYLRLGKDGIYGDGGSWLSRKQAQTLRDYLSDHLEETASDLPVKPYAVVDARVVYDFGSSQHRLVLVSAQWLDEYGNDHDPKHITSFEVLSEGLDL